MEQSYICHSWKYSSVIFWFIDQKLSGDFVNQSYTQSVQVCCWISDSDKDL